MKKDVIADDVIKEKYDLSILFDYYGELLGEHKSHIFEDYMIQDLSLGEIAEAEGISRQGVYDIIRRCSIQLKDYEEKLKIRYKNEQIKDKLELIQKSISDKSANNHTENAEKILKLTVDIINIL